MNEKPLTDTQRRVLESLAREDVGWYCPFGTIEGNLNLDRNTVRKACRDLASMGLAEYKRGLVDEDGRTGGSGYGITHAGLAAINEEARRDRP